MPIVGQESGEGSPDGAPEAQLSAGGVSTAAGSFEVECASRGTRLSQPIRRMLKINVQKLQYCNVFNFNDLGFLISPLKLAKFYNTVASI